jgi:hypothetical protein
MFFFNFQGDFDGMDSFGTHLLLDSLRSSPESRFSGKGASFDMYLVNWFNYTLAIFQDV